ncbi:MAG: secretion protein F [Actinomycetota bacterium]|nr:secretion protein F [Actinomycetota bacterium]
MVTAPVAEALCCSAAAMLVWPDPRSARAGRSRRPAFSLRLRLPGVAVGCCLSGAIGVLLGGVLTAVAALMFGGTALHLARRSLAERSGAKEWAELLAALRMLARELRSGAAPVAAATSAASAVGGAAGELLTDLAAAARLGVDRAMPVRAGPTGQVAERLRAGLRLSVQHGVPWAALIEAFAVDVADRVQAASDRGAQVAGPRFSGYVLAALPVFGLLLGAGMGANPLRVLLGPAPGGLLLPVGAALTCAGLLWSARIVGS